MIARAVALCVCLGGALAPESFAQTLPLPVIPTVPPSLPTQPGTPPEAQPTTPVLPQWEYVLGVDGGYSTNVYFLPDGPGDGVVTPHAELTRILRGPTGEMRVGASTRAVAYLAQGDDVAVQGNEVAVDAALSASGRHEASDRTTVTGQISGGLGHTDESVLLSEQGILLPFSRTRFGRAEAGVLWRTAARTTLELRGRAYYDDFVEPELVDGRSLRGSLNLGRRLSERSKLSAEYSVERTRSDASYTTQYASLQLERRLSARSSLLIEGGSSRTGYSMPRSDRPPTWEFYGGASLVRVVGSSSTAVFARREVIPAFGVGGVALADRIGLSTTSRIGPTWELSAEASYIRRSASRAGGDRSDSEDARFALQKRLGPRFELGTELEYRRYAAAAPRPAIEQFRAQLTVAVLSRQTGGVTP